MIRLENVHKRFEDGTPVLVDVSCTVGVGDCVLLTGPSGAGKTTLLRLMALQDRPTSGRLVVGGTDLARIDAKAMAAFRRRVPLLFQDRRLLPNASILDNVALPLVVAGVPRARWQPAARAALADVGIVDRLERPARALSVGEHARVALARAIVGRPDVLLADEPIGHLDRGDAADLLTRLRSLATDGMTVVVTGLAADTVWLRPHRELRLDAGRLEQVPRA